VENKTIDAATASSGAHPARVDPVVVSKFQVVKVLGQGGQGKVCLGTYEGIKVAGKTFLSPPGPEQMKEVLEELKFFTQLDHPNCNYLVGAKTTLEDGGIMLLTEVCDNGSIFDLYSKKNATFKISTATRFARECAVGYQHIHGMGYMHRDIKSLNVFLTGNYTCQVADFGMCIDAPTTTGMCGTGQWMAPEVGFEMLGRGAMQYDKRCDVYSYAVLIWECFHTTVPYSDRPQLDQGAIVQNVAMNLLNPGHVLRPTINPSKCPPPIVSLIQRCWSANAGERPGWTQIISELDAFAASLPPGA